MRPGPLSSNERQHISRPQRPEILVGLMTICCFLAFWMVTGSQGFMKLKKQRGGPPGEPPPADELGLVADTDLAHLDAHSQLLGQVLDQLTEINPSVRSVE